MNEHFVTSREWSKRLKKAGVEEKAEYWWEFDGLDEYKLVSKKEKLLHQGNGSYSRQRFYAAYLTDELAGMLPERISHRRCLYITPTPEELRPDENNWYVFYEKATTFFEETNNPEFGADTLPNALAAMVEYLRKEKII